MYRSKINSPTKLISTKYWVVIFGLITVLISAPIVLGYQTAWAADSCSAPATNYGTDTMKATIPGTASYTVWTHMEIPSSSANSVLLNVNGTCYNVGASTSIPTNTWEWIDYYDGKSTNTIKQSLNQGSQNVELIGTASGVLVDQLEFISGSTCTPTGNGSNCASTTTTTSGSSGSRGGAATAGSSAGSNSYAGTVVVGGSGTSGTGGSATQVGSPFTAQAVTSTSAYGPVKEVQYYLNKKLLATVTTSPYSYYLNTKKILNGTYTFTTKTTYTSGKVVSTSQKLVIKNPASVTQFMLAAEHYIVLESVVLLVLIIGFLLLRKLAKPRRPPVGTQPPAANDGSSGESPYVNPVSGTITPTEFPQTPTAAVAPTDNPPNNGDKQQPPQYQ